MDGNIVTWVPVHIFGAYLTYAFMLWYLKKLELKLILDVLNM